MQNKWQMFNVSLVLLMAAAFAGSSLFAQQNLTQPRQSPHATVSQRIGLTDITIDYNRPRVNNREIWGTLVPYGLAPGAGFNFNNQFPWRAGANENTTISFTDEVTVQGTKVPAGTYGVHIIPEESGEWTLILSKDHQQWGSFFYDKANDQARVKVAPQDAAHQEWLMYGFDGITNNSTTAYLHWEKKKIPFTIEVDVTNTVLANMRAELTGLAGFNNAAWQRGANFCLQNNTNHEEALVWIDRAIQGNNSAANVATKAALLSQSGKDNTMIKSELMTLAKNDATTEADVNAAGYVFLFSNHVDEALDLFKLNVERFPESWNPYDSLAEGYERKGDTANAIKYYEMAYDKAPAGQHARIEATLSRLKGDS